MKGKRFFITEGPYKGEYFADKRGDVWEIAGPSPQLGNPRTWSEDGFFLDSGGEEYVVVFLPSAARLTGMGEVMAFGPILKDGGRRVAAPVPLPDHRREAETLGEAVDHVAACLRLRRGRRQAPSFSCHKSD